jgi:hypothetical protein
VTRCLEVSRRNGKFRKHGRFIFKMLSHNNSSLRQVLPSIEIIRVLLHLVTNHHFVCNDLQMKMIWLSHRTISKMPARILSNGRFFCFWSFSLDQISLYIALVHLFNENHTSKIDFSWNYFKTWIWNSFYSDPKTWTLFHFKSNSTDPNLYPNNLVLPKQKPWLTQIWVCLGQSKTQFCPNLGLFRSIENPGLPKLGSNKAFDWVCLGFSVGSVG